MTTTERENKMVKISAWKKGVALYAAELMEALEDQNLEPTRENMLYGASSWLQYSLGGCSLIAGEEIADRLCTPSELRRVTGAMGETRRMANSRETWLEVQARALAQACRQIEHENEG